MQHIIDLDNAIKTDNLDEIFNIICRPTFDINTPGRCNFTPIILAVQNNKPALVRVFLKMGANPCSFVQSGYLTPLLIAIKNRNVEILKILLNDPRTRDYTHLGSNRNICGYALHEAAEIGDSRVVELLLQAGADPTKKMWNGKNTSDYAREHGHDELCVFLKQREMTLQQLIIDKFNQDEKVVAFKKEHGKFYPLTGSFQHCRKLLKAIKQGNVVKVRALIHSGQIYDDAVCTDAGATGSWYACQNGSLEIVRILFSLGASMTISCYGSRGDEYYTAIEIARKNGHIEIAEYLESLKAQQIEIFREFAAEQKSKTSNISFTG